tara:strand:+ start:3400 stop:4368 length:969 start_codon:yes stop_codon:yes gene_type:complete
MQNKIFSIQKKEQFEKLALEMFDYQMKNNQTYAQYATLLLKGNRPKNIIEIPFLPIHFFKTKKIICKERDVEQIFLSSGTLGEQSKHLISDIEIYKKSFTTSFNLFYGDTTQYCILSLLPNYREREGSSLIYMIDDLIKKSNNKNSGFYLNKYEKLAKMLTELEAKEQKTILFGVSYALLDLANQFPQKLKNTIIIETGGMKGKRKEMLKEELHNKLKSAFSLLKIHSEYGMTELLSQSYSKGDGIFQPPPWKRILIRDIKDPLSIIGDNKIGGINIIDLANIYSCPFIATEDIGKRFENTTFKISGRLDNSELRGCNLLIE